MPGSSIGTLKAFLTLDPSGFVGGFGVAGKAATGFSSGLLSRVGGAFAGFGAQALAAGAAIATAGLSFHGLFESLGEVKNLSVTASRLGITVEETQKLGMAAAQTGVDLDTLSDRMLMMGKNIGSGGTSLDKRLGQVADEFVRIKDVGKRAEFARGVFGKGGFDMMNLLAKGSVGIRQSADAVDKFGLAIKDVDAAKAKEALLALKELKEVTQGLKNQFAVQVAPALTIIFKSWLEGIASVLKQMKEFQEWVDSRKTSTGNTVSDYLVAGAATFGNILSPKGYQILAERAAARSGKKPTDPGAAKGMEDGFSAKTVRFASGAAERGTVEAGRLIQGAKQTVTPGEKVIADKLDAIKRNTDPRRAPATPRMARGRL